MKSTAANDNRRVTQTLLRFQACRYFLEIHITQIEPPATPLAFDVLISQFLENDMFSIEMDPPMEFRSSKGFEKALTFRIFIERICTSSSVIEYL